MAAAVFLGPATGFALGLGVVGLLCRFFAPTEP
jgi:hypothetical protein